MEEMGWFCCGAIVLRGFGLGIGATGELRNGGEYVAVCCRLLSDAARWGEWAGFLLRGRWAGSRQLPVISCQWSLVSGHYSFLPINWDVARVGMEFWVLRNGSLRFVGKIEKVFLRLRRLRN
jgi:hypothetical protein